MRWRAFISLLAALLSVLLLGPAVSGAAAASFAPCTSDASFSCATVPVPLDRSGAVAGTIPLSVERRTPAGSPSRSALLALAGGPGQAALPLGKFIAEAISPALGARDLLLFDQRGTGASGPLSCPALTGSEASAARSFSEAIERCARQLGPARGSYTTAESVEDIESVRRTAGYDKLVLYGTSYGTKVALEYAQRYPQHVEALVLDSIEKPEGPEPFHLSTFRAMRPALAELCSQDACRGASPLSDLARLVAATGKRTLTVYTYDGNGHRSRHTLTSRDLLDLMLGGDLNPVLRSQVPAALHAAVGRDLAPLGRLLALTGVHPAREEPSGEIDLTLYVTTACEEYPFPWQRGASEAIRIVEAEAAINAVPGASFYPFNPETALGYPPTPICVYWPDASSAPKLGGAPPNVPTLIFSGGQDLRTPTADAQQIAATIPDAQLVRVPYTGHSVIGSDVSGCARAALSAFFAGAPVSPCAAAPNPFPPAPIPPRRLADVAPLTGTHGRTGRTLAATLASLRDLRRAIVEVALDFGQLPVGTSFGGLRGGSVRMTSAGARLSNFAYVPGLRLTGLVPTGILLKDRGPAANLAISGSAAAAGRLRVAAGGRLSGLLGGRRVSTTVPARLAAARAGGPTPQSFRWPALAHLR